MSAIRKIFQDIGDQPNIGPKPIPMTGILLQCEVIPVGVFFYPIGREQEEIVRFKAAPLALFLRVVWIAEPGILYCNGQIVGVGEAYRQDANKYTPDARVDVDTTAPDSIDKLLGVNERGIIKVDFTELCDLYFDAVRRASEIPQLKAAEYRKRLSDAFEPFPFDKTPERKEYLTMAVSEAGMTALIEKHRERSK